MKSANAEKAEWYVIHTYSGYEANAKDSIEKIIENNNLQDYIFDIKIPVEQVIEEKNGKRKIVEKKLFPTYIFVKMVCTNDIWFMITNTRGITGFCGPGGRPLPLTEEEVKRNKLEKVTLDDIDFKIDDKVIITGGALDGYDGVVVSISASNEKAKVAVSMFGRDQEVDVSFDELKRIDARVEIKD